MLLQFFRSLFSGGIDSGVSQMYLIQLLLSLPVFLISLSFHEAGHAYAAYRCGDPTAKMLGRMTLNPIKHIDPIGFGMLMIVGFGWAKPVPVNPRNFRNGRRDDFFVSIAGICANLILVLLSALLIFVLYLVAYKSGWTANRTLGYVSDMLGILVSTNLVLAFFNLIPVPPLDGYHIFNDLFFRRSLFAPQAAQRAGQLLLIVLLFTGAVDAYLRFVQLHVLGGLNTLINMALNALL